MARLFWRELTTAPFGAGREFAIPFIRSFVSIRFPFVLIRVFK
jgi:hypothetical protein